MDICFSTENEFDFAPLGIDDDLETATIISLFCWNRSNTVPELYGWFSDPNIGSSLWRLLRSKIKENTLNQVKLYCEEALQWMIDDGIASAVTALVEPELNSPDRINVLITIIRDDGTEKTLTFNNIWNKFK